uniref:Uncharacterized protein n=1 Tax=Ipomoea trifida TaxID=35884 RepID=A0PAC2_IPOTF|nr:hypothetical protein [Ipomoea trifida]
MSTRVSIRVHLSFSTSMLLVKNDDGSRAKSLTSERWGDEIWAIALF